MKLGDRVTVVTGPARIARHVVVAVALDGSTFDTALHRLRISAEGIDWIRGYHTEDSPEGQALLAACLLVS
jgi:hypothetical protein